jgi:hypothetical protein
MFILLFTDPDIVLSMFILSFMFVIVCGLFEWKRISAGLDPIKWFNYHCLDFPFIKNTSYRVGFILTTSKCL